MCYKYLDAIEVVMIINPSKDKIKVHGKKSIAVRPIRAIECLGPCGIGETTILVCRATYTLFRMHATLTSK